MKELEKKAIRMPCEYVILKGVFFGEITITNKFALFTSSDSERPDNPNFKFGALVNLSFP